MKTTKETKSGMKRVAVWSVLVALTAIGAGCSSVKESEIQMGEDVPVENAIAPEATPQDVAPVPEAVAGETADEGDSVDAPLVMRESPSDLYRKELQRHVDVSQYILTDDDKKVYSFSGASYFAQHPDVQIKGQDDRSEDVEYVINLTPEQKQAILQKYADKIPMKEIPLEKLKCLLSGQSSSDCED